MYSTVVGAFYFIFSRIILLSHLAIFDDEQKNLRKNFKFSPNNNHKKKGRSEKSKSWFLNDRVKNSRIIKKFYRFLTWINYSFIRLVYKLIFPFFAFLVGRYNYCQIGLAKLGFYSFVRLIAIFIIWKIKNLCQAQDQSSQVNL